MRNAASLRWRYSPPPSVSSAIAKNRMGNALPAPKRRRMVDVKVLARLCTVTTCLELATDSVTGRSRSRDPREIKNYTIKFIILVRELE